MSTTGTLIKGRTVQRLFATFEQGGGRADLTSKTPQFVLQAGASTRAISATALVQSGSTLGQVGFVVTDADLTALGDPAQVVLSMNVWNADDSLFMRARMLLNVEV